MAIIESNNKPLTVSVIGAGAAALAFASYIDTRKYRVTLYERKKHPGRKLSVAGEGGLNISFDCGIEELIGKYHPSGFLDTVLREFPEEKLQVLFKEFGIETYTGSSKRIFADAKLKPPEIAEKIIAYVVSRGVEIKTGMKWQGLRENNQLIFECGSIVESDITVFAMGGFTWKSTGSDGKWAETFRELGISVNDFRAANCGFGLDWNKDFLEKHEGKPLKNIALTYDNQTSTGELVITASGIEGNAVYALSRKIQDGLAKADKALVYLDLKPTVPAEIIKLKYQESRRKKVTEILEKDINLDRVAIAMIKQFTSKEVFLNTHLLIDSVKALPIPLHAPVDSDKAISSLGGLDLDEVAGNFELKKIPNIFAIGEMLDWFAPTGGFLLHACFAMGYKSADYLNKR